MSSSADITTKVEHSSRDIASEVITKIQNQSYEFIYEYWN
jgi:hypothetical protein